MSRSVSSPIFIVPHKNICLLQASPRLLRLLSPFSLAPSLHLCRAMARWHGQSSATPSLPPTSPHGQAPVAQRAVGGMGLTRRRGAGSQSRSPPRELLQIVGADLLFLKTSAAPTAPVFLASSSPRFGPSSPSLRTSPCGIFLSQRSRRLAPLCCGRRSTCG